MAAYMLPKRGCGEAASQGYDKAVRRGCETRLVILAAVKLA